MHLGKSNRLSLLRWSLLLAFCFVHLSSVSAAISRGYISDDEGLKPGMVVATSENSSPDRPTVERADRERIESVIGVATDINVELVTIASGEQGVYVESGGEVSAFVSDINGEVKKGDLLTLSPLRGILMRGDAADPVIAIAQEDFPVANSREYPVQDSPGNDSARINTLRVNLDKQSLSGQTQVASSSTLSKLGKSVAGKEVSELRMIVALIIFFVVLISEGSIIYGSVSSAVTSLGRNPLAKDIIRHELIRVLFVALIVLLFGGATIYAILWV